MVHRHNGFKCRDVRILVYSGSANRSLKHTVTVANFYSGESEITIIKALLQTKFLQAISANKPTANISQLFKSEKLLV